MATILLFHHILGVRDGVRAFADAFTRAGHEVIVPDLYEGRVFEDIEAARVFRREVGEDVLAARAAAVAEGVGTDVVFAGFSMGAMVAQDLFQSRPAAACLMFLGFPWVDEDEAPWPTGAPVHAFVMRDDPFVVEDGGVEVLRELERRHPNIHGHVYDGHTHLFTEPSQPGYDAEATASVIATCLDVLSAL